jgi:hypothetical protein
MEDCSDIFGKSGLCTGLIRELQSMCNHLTKVEVGPNELCPWSQVPDSVERDNDARNLGAELRSRKNGSNSASKRDTL